MGVHAHNLDWWTEQDGVDQWRYEELARAGYDHEAALVLAHARDVDLHDAVALLKRGCSRDLALEILL